MAIKTEEKKVESVHWIPTEEEEKVRNHVYNRFKEMKNTEERVEAEADWDKGDKAYRAHVDAKDSDDYRSNINKPIAFSIIETELQETIERQSRPQVKAREVGDYVRINFVNDNLNYSFDIGNFDYQYYLAKKETLIRGTGFLFEYYREDKRTIKELKLVKNKETGEIEEEYKEKEKVDFDDVYAQYEPCENLYFESVRHIDLCEDMVRREVIHIDAFRRNYSERRGFKNIEYVMSGGDTGYYTYYIPPRDITRANEVEVIHYYNKATDEYNVLANDVVIRNSPLPYPHKELPVTVFYCYKIPNKFYGLGIPKIIQSLVDERNTLSNLRLDYQKYGINKMFFYDEQVDLEEEDLVVRPFGGIPINTGGRPIRDVFQWIEYSDVKPSSYREEEILIEDLRRTVGVDDRVQGLNVGGTATEAAILKESSMKRINAKMKLAEIDGMIRLGRLRLANIQFFYPLPKIERITSSEKKENLKKTYKTIRVEGKEYTIDDKGNLVMEEMEGSSSLKLDKKFAKFLEGEYDIGIEATAQTPLSKPLMQGKITEMFDRLTANPTILGQIDPRKAAHRYLQINEEDPEDWLTKEAATLVDQQLQADMENKLMSVGYPIPPTPGATPEHGQVHLNFTKTSQFEGLDDVIKESFEAHITGEAVKTGVMEGMETPNTASQMPQPGLNPADMTPNYQGREERGV